MISMCYWIRMKIKCWFKKAKNMNWFDDFLTSRYKFQVSNKISSIINLLCNFSKIDNKELILKLHTSDPFTQNQNYKVNVYALSYNILRIMSGMGGLAYSS